MNILHTAYAAPLYNLSFNNQQIDGPSGPDQFSDWLSSMQAWRAQRLAQINYDGSNYALPQLQWTQKSFVQPQMMIEDRYFYDPSSRSYTVSKYLDDLKQRYGGIDSVLVWPTYPNIGIDDRNTDDMMRSMPGGVNAVQQIVKDFQDAGVQVLFPIHPWDVGTRDPGQSWGTVLPATMAEIKADGLNGDTMSAVTNDYFNNSLQDGRLLALEPENGLNGSQDQLGWNIMSWGYWSYPAIPMVSINKWLEPRHMVQVNDRWSSDKTDMLQYAFFNGVGLETWENVWGFWNQMTQRDSETLRRISAIEHKFASLFVSPGWEPHTPTINNTAAFASKWPNSDGSLVVWTIVNRSSGALSGDQIRVPYTSDTQYYDLWNGVQLTPQINGNSATLSFPIEAKGYGAVLATTGNNLPSDFTAFLSQMNTYAQTPLSTFSSSNTILQQSMTIINPTSSAANAPDGMVQIPGGNFYFEVNGIEIEGDNRQGMDVQYPWENIPNRAHRQTLPIKSFYIDIYNVTNSKFKAFLDATHYQPQDGQNFLKDWTNGNYPGGWDNKPVTWVSLEDARAYASWAGKRLPHEWEWQYAAQGTDGRAYPWGNNWDSSAVPATDTNRSVTSPSDGTAFPNSASPYGVMNMVGNVWQWTDEFIDDHTRTAILRGGSYYQPQGAPWYFPQAYQNSQHGKYLLMAPGRDRSATIGLRCVQDTPANTSGGTLTGATGQLAAIVNLTDEGTVDWAHWGASNPSSFDHKYNVASQISGFSVIGNDTVKQYSDNPNGYSWNDGTPNANIANTTTGIYLVGVDNGFQLVLPAGTTPRTLRLYVGVWRAQGHLQATLSDGTSVTYDDTSLDNSSGTSNLVYTINYMTPTVGQVLTVKFTVAKQYYQFGNVTLQAATIS